MCTLLYDVQCALYNTMYIVYAYKHGSYYEDIYNTYMYCTLEWMKTTKFILHTCDVMGLDLLLCEKNHICSIDPHHILQQVNCSGDMLCDHQQQQQQGAITSCYIVLLCTTVVYTSVQQLQDPPSLIRCTMLGTF
jgi:hypothetical protein